MGSHGRKQYTVDFKREAAGLITEQGYSVAEAAKGLGMDAGLLVAGKQKRSELAPSPSWERPPNAGPGGTPPSAGGESAAPDGTGYFKKATVFFASKPQGGTRL